MSFKLIRNPKKYISLGSGRKTSSGYELIRDKTQTDGYDRQRWVKVGGIVLKSPGKLYDAKQDDEISFAYDQTNMEMLAYWNHNEKKGSSSTILGLIFHPLFWIILALAGIYFFWFRGPEDVLAEQRPYVDLGAVILVAGSFVYSFFDWRATRMAHQKLDQMLRQRGHKN